MIIILDDTLKIVYANRKLLINLKQLLGVELVPGNNLKQHIANENIKLLYFTLKEILSQSNYHRIPFQVPIVDDQFICSIDPVPDQLGKLDQIIITFTISSIEGLLQENKEIRQNLKESNDAVVFYKRLLETMVHDLNGSLNSIILMSSNEFDTNEHLDFIPNINKLAQYSDSAIKGVLSLVENSNETKREGVTKICLLDLFEEILKKQKNAFEINPHISLTIDQNQEINFIRPFLYSIFHNIIQNSFKFRSAKRQLQIDISTKIADNYLVVVIKDNGIGIDLKKDGHLLHMPFKQIDVVKNGYGVGLYLVYTIMDIANGKINIVSEPDKGTSFSLCFPI